MSMNDELNEEHELGTAIGLVALQCIAIGISKTRFALEQ